MRSKPEIKVVPPGPVARKIIKKDHRYIATSTKTSLLAIKSGAGALIEDVDGNTYLDFSSGVGVLNVGQSQPEVVRAIQQQAEKFIHFAGTDFYYSVQNDLAELLAKLAPGATPKKIFFTNSGTESTEAAIKLARWHSRRPRFIAYLRAFHGRSMGSLSLTASKPVHRERFFPTMPGVTHIPFSYCYRCAYKMEYPQCDLWCAKILDEVYFQSSLPPGDVAALFMEPVQGEGGYIVPPPDYFLTLKKILDRHGIMLIDDEVQAGFGRTGTMFAIEHFGDIEPDIITTAKGMGAGMPIGAIIFRSEYDYPVQGAHSNTYGGNPLACAASIAAINLIINKKMLSNAQRQGKYLNKLLNELKDKYELIGDVRGLGLMQATELVKNRRTKQPAKDESKIIVKEALNRGLILLPCGVSAIRYIPPLVITSEQIDMAIEILERCFKAIK